MSSDSQGDLVFECLHCGKTSILENLHAKQPRCARCGSGSGVLGDIGQGTPEARRARAREAGQKAKELPINFECLSCGHSSEVTEADVPVPQCLHCGSYSGIIIDQKKEPGGGT